MRLIDADALLERMRKDPLFPLVERYGVSGVIDAEPTAEPKTGHWIKISPAGIYECSQCGQNVMTGDIEVYAYCHHCGARMEGDQDAAD